jgi:hypothetical protein
MLISRFNHFMATQRIACTSPSRVSPLAPETTGGEKAPAKVNPGPRTKLITPLLLRWQGTV